MAFVNIIVHIVTGIGGGPLSRSLPRRGRYGKIMIALLVYALYLNTITMAKTWVEQEKVTTIWWVPGLLAIAVVAFYVPWRNLRNVDPQKATVVQQVQIIDRYIARNFLSGTAIVLAILLPLFGFLMLAEELEEVGNGTFTSFDALIVVGLSLPRLMLDLLPVTALLGVLIGLGAMANHRELIIINTFGYSARRTAWPGCKGDWRSDPHCVSAAVSDNAKI